MQVSNLAIWQAREPLQTLIREPWPMRTAYGLTKLAQKIGEQHAVIDEVRVQLITRYGTKNGTGITITPESPNWPAFAAAFNELMALTVEIPLEPIVLPETDIRVTPAALLALDPFIEVGP